jgi:hypothetical protein
MFERVQIPQEEEPRGLLDVIQFAGTACLFSQNVVNILEGLFKHGGPMNSK